MSHEVAVTQQLIDRIILAYDLRYECATSSTSSSPVASGARMARWWCCLRMRTGVAMHGVSPHRLFPAGDGAAARAPRGPRSPRFLEGEESWHKVT
jgi:hypothetical protein